MKIPNTSAPTAILAAMVLFFQMTLSARGQNAASAPANQPAPVQLSADVWDVLRLSHANVSDATITAYIKNSGKVYSLGASEILYLRDQGVSDQVVTAMINQSKMVAINAAQAAPQPAPTVLPAQPAQPVAEQPVQPVQPTVSVSESSPAYVPAPTQPAPVYVQTAPVYAQPSPVYVYPPSYSYYDSWPYYGSYWGYPTVSLSFGWGGHYGGYRGGDYHHGGGYGGGHAGGHFGGGRAGGAHFGGGGHR